MAIIKKAKKKFKIGPYRGIEKEIYSLGKKEKLNMFFIKITSSFKLEDKNFKYLSKAKNIVKAIRATMFFKLKKEFFLIIVFLQFCFTINTGTSRRASY